MIYDGSSFGTATFSGSDEEADYLGLPGLLDADQMRALLRQRQEQQLEKPKAVPAHEPPPQVAERVATADSLAQLRRELNSLVAVVHHRTGKPHGVIHGDLRRQCGGPPTAMANVEQLRDRIAILRSW